MDKNREKNIHTIFALTLFFIIAFFIGTIYQNFRDNKKINKIKIELKKKEYVIEEKKRIIEEKNKFIKENQIMEREFFVNINNEIFKYEQAQEKEMEEHFKNYSADCICNQKDDEEICVCKMTIKCK